jgi:hypothetical protein
MRFRNTDLNLMHAVTSYLKNLSNFFSIYLNKDYIYLKNHYTAVQFYFWTKLVLPSPQKKGFARVASPTKKTLHYVTLNCI